MKAWIDKTWQWLKKNVEMIRYAVVGGLTTVVSIVSFWFFEEVLHFPWFWANVLSWVLAVAFAFVGNKIYVFRSKNENLFGLIKEILSFAAMRLITLGLESLMMFLMIDLAHWNRLLAKTLATIVVVISNYVFSKFFIFTGKKEKPEKSEKDEKGNS